MMKKHKPAMMVLAESSQSPREIRKALLDEACRYLDTTTCTRQGLILRLDKFCDNHYWSNFSRKKTIEQVTARAFSQRQTRYGREWKQRNRNAAL